jgi:hypothetical protein
MLMDRFEKLAKEMAGMTRRDALRRAGGGLAGALLATFGLGKAARADDVTESCESDCEYFWGGPNGNRPKWGQCMNSCARCVNSAGGNCYQFNFTPCDAEPNCVCFSAVEGGGFCGADFFCGFTPDCKTSADCPSGWVCSDNTCCTVFAGFGAVCIPPCPVSPTSIYPFAPVGGGASGMTATGM